MAVARSRSEGAAPLQEEAAVSAFSRRERASVALLVASHRRLLVDEVGQLDTRSEKGAEACRLFLRALEKSAEDIALTAAPRDYREGFTVNYRNLFDGETRSYRGDILEAAMSLTQHPVIWANGEPYRLSGHAMRRAEALTEAWGALGAVLDTWVEPFARPPPLRCARTRLTSALDGLDLAWARFECAYILELQKVQEKARRLVEQAVDCERCLAELEQMHTREVLAQLPAYQIEKRALVVCIARLNSVANNQRKGRDDLSVGILDAAVELIEQSEEAVRLGGAGTSLTAARHLAEQVVDAFEDLRDYLNDIQNHLDLLHPQLCQNHSLVARLVRWEEAWEIGARYIHNDDVLGAVCYLVAQLRRASGISPALCELRESCDAELFLVLPRLVWLCLLADPQRAIELVRRLLPHRFEHRLVPVAAGGAQGLHRSSSNPNLALASELSRMEKVPFARVELQEFIERFWRVELLVTRAMPVGATTAREVLIQRAVAGSGSGLCDVFQKGPCAENAAVAVEEFMNDLEGWSMELQRHSPEDWNECANVLLQCLAASDDC